MILVTLAYIEGWTYVRRDLWTIDDVMAIKAKFLASMGYHIFLIMVLRVRGGPLLHVKVNLALYTPVNELHTDINELHTWGIFPLKDN